MAWATVLFLCTGNYYRSRFAEILFNTRVQGTNVLWRAESRGLAVDRLNLDNSGPLSPYALGGLARRGIMLEPAPRFPLPLKEDELTRASRIIALDESEHRPLLRQRFPHWVDCISYWHVPDLDRAPAEIALAAIEQNVTGLLQEFTSVLR